MNADMKENKADVMSGAENQSETVPGHMPASGFDDQNPGVDHMSRRFEASAIAVRITAIYLVLGMAWVIASDYLVGSVVSDAGVLVNVSMIKGILYVLVTGGVLYLLSIWAMKRVRSTDLQLIQSYQELAQTMRELDEAYSRVNESQIELKDKYRLLRDSEERYRLVSEAASDGIWDWDVTSGEMFFSDRWLEICGYSREEFEKLDSWHSLIHPDDAPQAYHNMMEHRELKTPYYTAEYRMRTRKGDYRWIRARGRALFDEDGEMYRMAGTHTDITPIKEYEEQLCALAYTDHLTGLPNRRALYRDLEQPGISAALAESAVFFIDVDNFKNINDTLGHLSGDGIIMSIAERLGASIAGIASLYRIGGDEFLLVMRDFGSVLEFEALARVIMDKMKKPFKLGNNIVHANLSIGIYVNTGEAFDVNNALRCADIALNRAKQLGRNRFVFYDASLQESITRRVEIEEQLRQAMDRQEFKLHYQPQYDVEAGGISGFEALLRWSNPRLGAVPPMEFIPVAEDTQIIINLGTWVIRKAALFLKRLHDQGYAHLNMAVNISVLQIVQDDFVDTVVRIVDSLGLPPSNLELEITETVLVESLEAIRPRLQELRDRGFNISLDDFGKGYSSLNYLNQLPITHLKIDKVFVDELASDDVDRSIMGFIILVGREMGLCLVAEGVESASQYKYLVEHRCNRIQGFYVGRPVPEEEALAMLDAGSGRD